MTALPRRLQHHYRKLSLGRQVALRGLIAFIICFVFLRALTYVIHYQILPIHNLVTKSGLHIHHLFWGILLLMVTAFAALATRDPKWHLRIAIVFGIALALTLDEFAMWLRLADVYWEPFGKRESLTAAFIAAAFLAAYAAGAPFWNGIVGDVLGKHTRSGKPWHKAS
ncbi:MAG TPA: hypothetical protein VKY31_04910 [Terriglobia bacterium]|nr:hypothetical protein [Terriglobia bacterium]